MHGAQAMSLMLPPAVQREDAPDDPVAAKLECMTLNGALLNHAP